MISNSNINFSLSPPTASRSSARVSSMRGPYPQYGWDFPVEIPETPERPRKLSQSVSWNSPREYGWDPPNPIIQGFARFQSISRILSPSIRPGTPLFSELVPERASQSWSWNSQQYWETGGILFREHCFREENSLSLTEFWGKLGEFCAKLGELTLSH